MDGIIYTIPYVLLTLFFGGMAYALHITPEEDEDRKRYILVATVFVFLWFFGLRGYILSDWISYYPYFYYVEWSDVFGLTQGKDGYEPGFAILTMLCKSIFNSYLFYSFVLSCINTWLLVRFMRRYTDNVPLTLMLYVVFEGIIISTNLMRNSIAIFIFLNAIPYLEQRKIVQYMSLTILAATFHVSALLYIPFYFVFHLRLNRWIYLAIFIVANIAFLKHISIVLTLAEFLGLDESMAEKVRVYTEVHDTGTKISIGYLERLMTGGLIVLYYNRLKEIRPSSAVFINATLAYLCFFFFFSEFAVVARRICTLFAFGYWVVWADLIKVFYFRNNRLLFCAFITLYAVMRQIGNCHYPDYDYDNVITGMKSYNERIYIHYKTFEEP